MLLLFLFLFAQTPSLLQQGLLAMQQGNLQEARHDLESAAQTDSQNPYVWTSLAEVYLRSKELKLASSAAQKAEDLAPNNPVVDQALAMYYAASGDNAHAVALAQKAAARDPVAAFRAAQFFLRKQDFPEAAAILETGIKAHPHDPQLILALGVARYGERRFEEAILNFLKVIHIDSTIPQPYEFLGRMLDQAGQHLAEITQDYRARVKAEPQNPQAQLLLAKALLTANSGNEEAEPLLRKSIALDDQNWESHYELGALLEAHHQYPEAAKELERGIQLSPKQAMPHYHLARVYDRLGQPDAAKRERDVHQALTSAKSGMQ